LKPFNEESDKKIRIIEKYNSTSSFYDNRYRKIQNEKFSLQLSITSFTQKTLLDAGCGTGLLFEYITNLIYEKCYRDLRYIGLDISWNMLQSFLKKVKNTKYRANISLILGDIEHMPFRGGVFNLLISYTSLQNLQSLRKGLEELFRVSKNNASLKLSILKKQLEIEEVFTHLESFMINLRIDKLRELEDVFIDGYIKKG